MKAVKIFQTLMISIFVVTFFTGCGESYDKNVMTVRNGAVYAYTDVPIGKAFDYFFSDGKWKSFKTDDKETVVEFNGNCTWYNSPAKIKIQFILDGEEFQVNYVGINGVDLDTIEIDGIMEKILSEYKTRGKK